MFNLPFFGLGFDLSPVLARARGMTLVGRRPPVESIFPEEPSRALSGYELLLWLGREIRAG